MKTEHTVVVVGATGYTGAEVLRWCLMHPFLRVIGATSRQHAGKTIDQLWPAMTGHPVPITAEIPEADIAFLCLPHGEAAKIAPTLGHRIVIDLSGDHRLPPEKHGLAYNFARTTPAWHYGLPELNRAIPTSGPVRIANPGCFATALALALLPQARLFPASSPPRVFAVGLTGSTGSGATPAEGTHHPMRAENLRPYKVLSHQHVSEVCQAIAMAGGPDIQLEFVPISAPLRRGILVTADIEGASFEQYRDYYQGNPLIRVMNRPPELLHVLGSARADIGVVKDGSTSVIFCAIDNLCRGAGSQAVANLNLALGLPAHTGLTAIPPVP